MAKVIGFPESIEQIVREEEDARLRKVRRAWKREKRRAFLANVVVGAIWGAGAVITLRALLWVFGK